MSSSVGEAAPSVSVGCLVSLRLGLTPLTCEEDPPIELRLEYQQPLEIESIEIHCPPAGMT